MGHDGTCGRCGAPVEMGAEPTWDVAAPPEALRDQGWVGFGEGRAVHLSCLRWSEAEALLGGVPRPLEDRRHREGRFTRAVAAHAPAA